MSKFIKITILVLFFQANLQAPKTHICKKLEFDFFDQEPGASSVASLRVSEEHLFLILKNIVAFSQPTLPIQAESLKDLLVLILNTDLPFPGEQYSDELTTQDQELIDEFANFLGTENLTEADLEEPFELIQMIFWRKLSEYILNKSEIAPPGKWFTDLIQKLVALYNANGADENANNPQKEMLRRLLEFTVSFKTVALDMSQLFVDPSRFISRSIILTLNNSFCNTQYNWSVVRPIIDARVDSLVGALLHENNSPEVLETNLNNLAATVEDLFKDLVSLQNLSEESAEDSEPLNPLAESGSALAIEKQQLQINVNANVIQKVLSAYLKAEKDLGPFIDLIKEYIESRRESAFELLYRYTAEQEFDLAWESGIGNLLQTNKIASTDLLGAESDGDKLLLLERLYFIDDNISDDFVKQLAGHFEWVAKSPARDDQAIAFSLSFTLDPYFSEIDGETELRAKVLEVTNSFAAGFPFPDQPPSNWNSAFYEYVLTRFNQKEHERADLAPLLFVIFVRAKGSVASLKLGGVPHKARTALTTIASSLTKKTRETLELKYGQAFTEKVLLKLLSKEPEPGTVSEEQKALNATLLGELKQLNSLVAESNFAAALPPMIIAGAPISFKKQTTEEHRLI